MSVLDRDSEQRADVECAIETIREHGVDVRDEQFERALGELDDADLTDAQREVIESLSERLVARLIAVPETQLRRLAASGDDAAVETAQALFGSD